MTDYDLTFIADEIDSFSLRVLVPLSLLREMLCVREWIVDSYKLGTANGSRPEVQNTDEKGG